MFILIGVKKRSKTGRRGIKEVIAQGVYERVLNEMGKWRGQYGKFQIIEV